MEGRKAVYQTLEREMKLRKIRNEHLAICIEKSVKTVENKMNGETPWLWDECIAIHATYFHDVPLVELFGKDEAAA